MQYVHKGIRWEICLWMNIIYRSMLDRNIMLGGPSIWDLSDRLFPTRGHNILLWINVKIFKSNMGRSKKIYEQIYLVSGWCIDGCLVIHEEETFELCVWITTFNGALFTSSYPGPVINCQCDLSLITRMKHCSWYVCRK